MYQKSCKNGSTGQIARNGDDVEAEEEDQGKDETTSLKEQQETPKKPKKKQQQDPTFYSNFINEKAKMQMAKERKAARTMTIVVSIFVVCWLPFFLMYVILPYCPSCTLPSEAVSQFKTN